jgi:putative (di)nucleoside polyphosphate hydrolase
MVSVIDSSGFRPNIGIILANHAGRVFWAKRVGRDAWQFPQGGMNPNETPEQTLFRELEEEIGLRERDVTLLGRTDRWLKYRLPTRMIRKTEPVCIGQKQLWFLLRLEGDDRLIRFDKTQKPEFDGWQWVSYWFPLRQVVLFKREVYRRALKELAPLLFGRFAAEDIGERSLDYLL